MDPERLQALLEAVRADRTTIPEALQKLRELPFQTLEFARVDTHRHLRTGFPEVVLGEGKTPSRSPPSWSSWPRGDRPRSPRA